MDKQQPLTYHRVLTIAGSDSSAGAGIQADLKTIAALGCYGASAITALTAQNTTGILGIHPVPPAFVSAQIRAVLTDVGADAVKVGMVYSAELMAVIAAELRAHEAKNIVVDPVMAAQTGDSLFREAALSTIKESLMPLAEVFTPNLPEAGILLGYPLDTLDAIRRGARELARHGSRYVLIKGGHARNGATDILYSATEDRFMSLPGERIPTRNDHGTGCTLSSAIASFLARGDGVETAVARAKSYIEGAIRAGARYAIGQGRGPLHHFFGYW
uniref:hydroxymethylpyrimidine kinase n=1 Tax=Candidatus Kentrum sp. DK TaxID=2126562 RepID=A0A450T160_9GAMM|nr:MAG: hydroxymethylpyrimidine/phosphomethylpyrimidine kinase [Candidatus Kentron sp. DK]